MSKDPREDKLPRWAQDLLTVERRRADVAEERLDEHLQTVEKTRIWYGDYENKIYVPEYNGHQNFHFRLGQDEFYNGVQVRIVEDQWDKTGHPTKLEIQGGHKLAVEMQSANTFQVRFVD